MHAGTVQDEGSEFLEYIHYQDNLTAYNTWLPKRFQGQMIDAVNKTYPVKNVACQQALCSKPVCLSAESYYAVPLNAHNK